MSSFSFFEAYFIDVLKEVVEFHGGDKLLEKVALKHNLALSEPDTLKAKRKLQEYPTGDRDRYRSGGRKLRNAGYLLPSALLARYGLQKLLLLSEGDYIRAVDIPGLIQDVFQLDLDQSRDIDTFHGYRETRNKIAHGRASSESLHLKRAVEANNFLRNLALRIDQHVVTHFLLVEDL